MPAPSNVVHEMIRAGGDTVDEISEVTRWPRRNIEAAVAQLGLVIGSDDKPRKRTVAASPLTAPAEAAPARPTLVRADPPAPMPANCSHAQLVSWAASHPKAAIRSKGAKFEALMADLVTARRELDAEDKARAERERVRREALAEVERLKAQLAEAERRARGARVGSPAAPKVDGRKSLTPEQLEAKRALLAKAREAKAAKRAKAMTS